MGAFERAAFTGTVFWTFFNNAVQWYTQVTTYPLFGRVGRDAFVEYHKAYERKLPLSIYGPYSLLMASNLALLLRPPSGVGRGSALALFALNGSIMATSLALAVPIHTELDREGASDERVARLVRVNGVRLAAATASSLIALRLLTEATHTDTENAN